MIHVLEMRDLMAERVNQVGIRQEPAISSIVKTNSDGFGFITTAKTRDPRAFGRNV